MSTKFYCTFSKEQALHYQIPSGGWVEIEANDIGCARDIACKWFPATARLPFGGWGEIYTDEELQDRREHGYFKTGKLGWTDGTTLAWTFIGGGQAA